MRFDVEWPNQEGHPCFFENLVTPLFDGNNTIIGVLVVIQDITERKGVEKELHEKSTHLSEANAALRTLLRHRGEDRKDFEDTVTSNLKHLVAPHLENLKNSPLSGLQRSWVESLEQSLNQLTSAFISKLTIGELDLSNAEIRVAALVREGKSTKEIAGILMVSEKTVSAHRDSIRKKLGLRGKTGGLRSLLMHLSSAE